MAFLRNQDNQSMVRGEGGIAGEGTPVGGSSRTSAGRPNSWYNIQDFLSANPNPNIAQRVQQRAGEAMGQARQQAQQQIQGVQQAPAPEAYSTDRFTSIREGGITPGETQNLRSFLGQSIESAEPGQQAYELSPEQQIKDVANPFKDVKPGDFGSIMSWYGNAERPSSDYTPGMQKMDEMLFRGSDAAKTFPDQMESQYQSEVMVPIQQRRDQLRNEQAQAKKDFEQQRTNWTQGISSFLEGEDKKIQDIYEQQQQQLAESNRRTLQDIAPQYYNDLSFLYPQLNSGLGNKGVGNINNPIGRYFTKQEGVTPDLNTAALAYFSDPQQFADYNTLAGLIGQANPYDINVTPFSPSEFSFDPGQFTEDWRRKYKGLEQAKLNKRISDYGQALPTVDDPRQPFLVPEFFDTKYGRIINDMAQAGEMITPTPLEVRLGQPVTSWGPDDGETRGR